MNRNCPNLKCNSNTPGPDGSLKNRHIVRFGDFYRKDDSRKIERFRCTVCKKTFSAATDLDTYRQHKRRINPLLYKLFASGMTQRRAAIILGINRKTVIRKFRFLAKLSRRDHEAWLKELSSDPKFTRMEIQFDDLETSEHSKCKPISVAIAVDPKTRKILSYQTSPMPAKGLLKKKALKKYGKRKDKRKDGWNQMMKDLQGVVHPEATFTSDENPHYPPILKRHFPSAVHKRFKGRRGCVTGQGELKSGGYDPLFSLNHTCAMLRAHISRLFRRTWNTTKNIQGLKDHLAIYVRLHNEVLTDELVQNASAH